MNFTDAMKIAYSTDRESRMSNLDVSKYIYIRRPSRVFDIRILPYCCNPETKRRIEPENRRPYLGPWEWGIHITQDDVIAEDWIVSKEELKW